MQPYFAFLDIALWYAPNRHLCVYGAIGGARGALLWTIVEKVLCLRGSALQKLRLSQSECVVAVGVIGRARVELVF